MSIVKTKKSRTVKTQRMNISLPDEVYRTLKRKIRKRQISSFITEAVKSRFSELERRKLEEKLIDGYQATRDEDLKLYKEFELTVSNGLDDD